MCRDLFSVFIFMVNKLCAKIIKKVFNLKNYNLQRILTITILYMSTTPTIAFCKANSVTLPIYTVYLLLYLKSFYLPKFICAHTNKRNYYK